MISQLVSKLSLPFLNATSNIIKNEVNETKEKLIVNIEKRTIPRPDELGPLPPLELNTSLKSQVFSPNTNNNEKSQTQQKVRSRQIKIQNLQNLQKHQSKKPDLCLPKAKNKKSYLQFQF